MFSIGGSLRAPVRYHPCIFLILILSRYPGGRQYLVGSLTGAVASQNVTEAFKGWLGPDGNRAESVNA